MYAIEFVAKVNNGKIDIPQQFLNKFNSDVKVILLKTDQDENILRPDGIKTAKGFGALAHKANPSLWEHEKNAWERHVIENYDNN